jgi:CubicO group peptidase (beta-lactamase class C family)
MADYSNNVPNNADTKYLIGSTTKHFTAILILQMVEKGLLNLDDTIKKFFPDGPIEKTGKITIRHLLLHQSGIPQCYSGFPDYLATQSKLFHTQEEYLQLIWNSKLRHEPGKGVTYTTPGYYLLGVILEKVSNKSYAELLKENILVPLKMESTFVDNNLTVHKNMATGYQKGITGIVTARKNEESNHFGGGDLISTSADLFRFQQCLSYESDKILSSKYKKLLLETQIEYNANVGSAFIGSKYKQAYQNGTKYLEMVGVGTSTAFGFRTRMTRFINNEAAIL